MTFLMLALLAAPMQDREESSGFSYAIPKNWVKRVDPATKSTTSHR